MVFLCIWLNLLSLLHVWKHICLTICLVSKGFYGGLQTFDHPSVMRGIVSKLIVTGTLCATSLVFFLLICDWLPQLAGGARCAFAGSLSVLITLLIIGAALIS